MTILLATLTPLSHLSTDACTFITYKDCKVYLATFSLKYNILQKALFLSFYTGLLLFFIVIRWSVCRAPHVVKHTYLQRIWFASHLYRTWFLVYWHLYKWLIETWFAFRLPCRSRSRCEDITSFLSYDDSCESLHVLYTLFFYSKYYHFRCSKKWPVCCKSQRSACIFA